MAQRPKAKRKRKSQKGTDEKQSARFIEAARAFDADETGKEFSTAISKLLPRRTAKKGV
jgi:hypothetical protein